MEVVDAMLAYMRAKVTEAEFEREREQNRKAAAEQWHSRPEW